MKDKQNHMVILGAGYAGMMTAIRLAGKTKKHKVRVTLINAAAHFSERPRLQEVATGNPPRLRPIAQMLEGTTVQFCQGYATKLDAERQKIHLQTTNGEEQIPYDYLVMALGSQVDRDSVPGVRDHAYTLDANGPLTAEPLYERLQEMVPSGGRVVVVGSGPTGIEAAAEIADCFPRLQVMMVSQGTFGSFTKPHIQAYMRQSLQRLKVQIVEQVTVAELRAGSLVGSRGQTIPFDLCVWAGGFKASPLAHQAGVQVNQQQQILAGPYLNSLSHPTVYAVGDAVHPTYNTGAPLRMSLLTALVTAAHVADNLTCLLQGKEQRTFGFSTYGQGIALGRHDAVGFNTFPNDQPIGPLATGRLGLAIRNFFVWLLLFVLTLERRWPGFFFWLGRNRGRVAAAGWQPLSTPAES